MKLEDKYYDAIVVSDDIDPRHGGAVRVKIFGVTDELKNNEQPFAIPATKSIMAVPTKGTYLRVAFDDGDVNQPKYEDFSPEKTYLPSEYVDSYPEVAVANLGGDFFIMTHDRNTQFTNITHPSDSTVIWNRFGTIIHDSDKAYNNTGLGANDGNGKQIQPVLTEGTIDVFCCTPVGAGDLFQGSEYLQVADVSKESVDIVNGIGTSSNLSSTDADPLTPIGIEESVTKPIFDADGNVVEDIEFMESPSFIENETPRDATHIIIGVTGHNNFLNASRSLLDKGNNLSAHYLIGRKSSASPANSTGDSEITEFDKSSGFAQYVELNHDTSFGSTTISPKNPIERANKGAISILLVSSDIQSITSYQNDKVEELKVHIKNHFKNSSMDVYTI